jgi:hypothetical protein
MEKKYVVVMCILMLLMLPSMLNVSSVETNIDRVVCGDSLVVNTIAWDLPCIINPFWAEYVVNSREEFVHLFKTLYPGQSYNLPDVDFDVYSVVFVLKDFHKSGYEFFIKDVVEMDYEILVYVSTIQPDGNCPSIDDVDMYLFHLVSIVNRDDKPISFIYYKVETRYCE